MKSSSWKNLRRFNESLRRSSWKFYLDFLRQLCQEHRDDELFEKVLGLIRAKDFDGLLEVSDSLVAQKHATAKQHFLASQVAHLIRKFPFPKGSVSTDPEGKARRTFLRSEHRCHRMNQKFEAFNKRSPYEGQLSRMRSFIQYVIGNDPPLQRVWSGCDFGPGASIGVHGNATNLLRKIHRDSWSVSSAALDYGAAAYAFNDHLFEYIVGLERGSEIVCWDRELFDKKFRSGCTIVSHNKITFVPKTAKTHRSIAIEPLVNGFVQKGVDRVIRDSLRRIGIDLSRQDRNQEFARLGSLDDSEDGYVTIDLESASDSISIGLVRNILPSSWYSFLNSIRSKSFLLDGVERRYEKFCSMGNGFCFPLETLIFVAVCHACGCGRPGIDYSVYGDDIIVRKAKSAEVLSLLREIGFRPNIEKTFLQGPFRESCGEDWFNGENVRPVTLDFELDSLESIIKLHNLTLRNERTTEFFATTRAWLLSQVPDELRFCRPHKGPVDSAFEVSQDVFLASRHARWSKDLQAWECKEVLRSAVKDRYAWDGRPTALLLAALRVQRTSDAPFTVRRKTRTKIRWNAYSGAISTWCPALIG